MEIVSALLILTLRVRCTKGAKICSNCVILCICSFSFNVNLTIPYNQKKELSSFDFL